MAQQVNAAAASAGQRIGTWFESPPPVLQPFANAAAERVRRMEEESRRRSAQRLGRR